MNRKNNVGEQIAYYRRLNAMTQEELAGQLNISAQAVSKWEQRITSPDISLLPELAGIFRISIDELFGTKIETQPVFDLVESVPWDDDRKIRIAVFHGKKLMQQSAYELQSGTNTVCVRFDCGKAYRINGIGKITLESWNG